MSGQRVERFTPRGERIRLPVPRERDHDPGSAFATFSPENASPGLAVARLRKRLSKHKPGRRQRRRAACAPGRIRAVAASAAARGVREARTACASEGRAHKTKKLFMPAALTRAGKRARVGSGRAACRRIVAGGNNDDVFWQNAHGGFCKKVNVDLLWSGARQAPRGTAARSGRGATRP